MKLSPNMKSFQELEVQLLPGNRYHENSAEWVSTTCARLPHVPGNRRHFITCGPSLSPSSVSNKLARQLQGVKDYGNRCDMRASPQISIWSDISPRPRRYKSNIQKLRPDRYGSSMSHRLRFLCHGLLLCLLYSTDVLIFACVVHMSLNLASAPVFCSRVLLNLLTSRHISTSDPIKHGPGNLIQQDMEMLNSVHTL